MMRSLLALGLALIALILSAQGYTEAFAFTNSSLISYETDFGVLKSISDNRINTPELNYRAQGRSTSEVEKDTNGRTEMTQSLFFSAIKKQGYGGFASISGGIKADNVKSMRTSLEGNLLTSISAFADPTVVESDIFGLGMAKPGTGKYEFSITGGYNTITTACVSPASISQTEVPKEFHVSFESYPLDLAEPADLLIQDVTLDFGVENNDLAYYEYDFSRTMEIDDITCNSEMRLLHEV